MPQKNNSASAPSETDAWRLDQTIAKLELSPLTAKVDLRNPSQGIYDILRNGVALDGAILGIATSDQSLGPNANVSDAFVRGHDLVVTYEETNQRPFSLQVYWRVVACDHALVLLDAILSVQTPLLESFPGVNTQSSLAGDEVWIVTSDDTSPTMLREFHCEQPQEHSTCVVLRAMGADWSYAEMAHPDDPGHWQIQIPAKGQHVLRRELGGTFLEKGVIQRLRIRGVFLPRQRDLELARQCMAEFAAEAPPLTV